MAESNRKQAEIPASAEMINNPVGTACGFAVQLNRCLMFFTPGVPSEFKVMVEQEILPRLRQRFTLPDPPVCLRLTTFGRSESELAQSLNPLTLPPGVVMGYRSSMPIIELKLTGPADQRDAMLALWPEVRKVAGDSLIFEGTEGLPAQIALPAGAAAEPDAQRAVYRRSAGAPAVPRRRAAAGQRSGSGAGGDAGAGGPLGGRAAHKPFCRPGAGGERPGERSS
jgi:molybdopterin-biosynthesis enzyme MoeA-like protein